MESARRVLVYLSREGRALQRAKFLQGVTGQFCGAHPNSAIVDCGLDQNRFIISDRPFPGSTSALLQRSPSCPIHHLTREEAALLPEPIRTRGVDVAVTILLQSNTREVLLTRRAKTLDLFPNVWVPPGGHMEPGEQLVDAGLRELREETGLSFGKEAPPWRILGLWESVFPALLIRGLPVRHHIVAFLLLCSSQSQQELQKRLRPTEQEVSACVWLDREVARRILTAQEGAEDSGRSHAGPPASLQVTEVGGGLLSQRGCDPSIFLPSAEGAAERVSAGTKYALRLWLETPDGRGPVQYNP